MPLRYQRPYMPRIYIPPRQAASRAPAAGRGGRGAAGTGVDTSSTGSVGGDIMKAIANTIQQNRQNAIANQILNTQNAPRAGLVAPGVNPQTGQANVIRAGTPTTGTSPLTGGVAELQARQQMQQQNFADRLNEAKIQAQLALARQRTVASRGVGAQPGSRSRWLSGPQGGGGGAGAGGAQGAGGGKKGAYVAGSGDVQNDPNTDNFNQIQADFDAQHGKGSYAAFTKNMGNLQDDGKGNMMVMKANPDYDQNQPIGPKNQPNIPVTDKNNLPVFSVPKADLAYWTNRYNAARIKGGQGYLGNLPDGNNMNSGQPSGSQVNPIAVKPDDNLLIRSLPPGTWLQAPDGTVRQKPFPKTAPQTSTDTGSQGNLAANAPPSLPPSQNLPADQNVGANAPLPQLSDVGTMPPPGQGDNSPQIANVASTGLPTTLPAQNTAAVSPMAAGQSYLANMGLAGGPGQLYPAADLYG